MQQIQLENEAFEGNNNVYLLEGEDGPLTLVDTGVAAPEIEAELRERLAAYDVTFADIERILLTHFHLDHSGLAGAIQEESDAEVLAHADDLPLVGQTKNASEAIRASYSGSFEAWSIPADKKAEIEDNLNRARRHAGTPVEATPLEMDRTYQTGSGPVEPVLLPGHTLGHVGYRLENGELIGGDALLPVYTPNIGGADPRVPHPLETYLETLATIVSMDPPAVWPGHRDRIDDPVARAHEIREHHRERTERVIETLASHGEMTVWELATELFGSLSSIHILHGPGEAFAHLDHLVEAGVVTATDGRYRLVDDEQASEELVPRLD